MIFGGQKNEMAYYALKVGIEVNVTKLNEFFKGKINLGEDLKKEPRWSDKDEYGGTNFHVSYSNIIFALPAPPEVGFYFHQRPSVFSNQFAGFDYIDRSDFKINQDTIRDYETELSRLEWRMAQGLILVYANDQLVGGAPVDKLAELQNNGKLSSQSMTGRVKLDGTDGEQYALPETDGMSIKMWHRSSVSWSLGYMNQVCNIYAECDTEPVDYSWEARFR